jgi:hypothetical protein
VIVPDVSGVQYREVFDGTVFPSEGVPLFRHRGNELLVLPVVDDLDLPRIEALSRHPRDVVPHRGTERDDLFRVTEDVPMPGRPRCSDESVPIEMAWLDGHIGIHVVYDVGIGPATEATNEPRHEREERRIRYEDHLPVRPLSVEKQHQRHRERESDPIEQPSRERRLANLWDGRPLHEDPLVL